MHVKTVPGEEGPATKSKLSSPPLMLGVSAVAARLICKLCVEGGLRGLRQSPMDILSTKFQEVAGST